MQFSQPRIAISHGKRGAWAALLFLVACSNAMPGARSAQAAGPNDVVASPGAVRTGLPEDFREAAPVRGNRMEEFSGNTTNRMLESLIGISPTPYLASMAENASLRGDDRLTTNAEMRRLPGIETRQNPNAEETVCGTDNRRRITGTTSNPWRWTCKLIITMPNNQKYIGTGWLAGPRCVMTAGHVVHDGGTGKQWAKRIEVIPGMNGSTRPYGTFVSTRFYSVNGWVKSANPAYDYGCIILSSNVGNSLGYFGFANYSTTTLRNMTMNTAGYPGDKPNGTLWFVSGPVYRVYSTELQYYADTYGGQSGSSVWRLINGKRYAVAIHVRGGCPNEGTRINTGVYNNIIRWRRL